MAAVSAPPAAGGTVRSDGGSTVLVPVFGEQPTDAAIELAVDLAAGCGGDVVVMIAATKPRQTPFDLVRRGDESAVDAARHAEAYARSRAPVECTRRVGASRTEVILGGVDAYGASTLVLGGPTPSPLDSIRRSTAGAVVERADCDVVVASRTSALDGLTSILVPVAGGPHAGRAVDIARVLASAQGAEIDFFHVTGSAGGDDRHAAQVIDAAVERLDGFSHYDTWTLDADDPAAAIIEQSQYYSATVLGWPRAGRLHRFVFGSTSGSVAKGADSPVLTVRNAAADQTWFGRWLAREP